MMSKVRVYELEHILPIFKVSRGQIEQITPVFEGEEYTLLDLNEESDRVDELLHGNISDWLAESVERGKFGEFLVRKYLIDLYGRDNVRDVSDDARIGYDIEVSVGSKILAFEVKTSVGTRIEITLNELNKAYAKQDEYNIFFVRICRENIRGYSINNPIRSLSIDYETLTGTVELDKISICPDQFRLLFKAEFLNALDSVSLETYAEGFFIS